MDLLYDEKTVREMYGAKAVGAMKGPQDLALQLVLRAHLARTFRGSGRVPGRVAVPPSPPKPTENEITKAMELVRAAKKPVLLLGSQATLGGPVRAQRVADAVTRLGIPAYLSGMSRGLLGARHPLFFRHHRAKALKDADLVILAGVPCDFRLNYGLSISRKARMVAVNRDEHDARTTAGQRSQSSPIRPSSSSRSPTARRTRGRALHGRRACGHATSSAKRRSREGRSRSLAS